MDTKPLSIFELSKMDCTALHKKYKVIFICHLSGAYLIICIFFYATFLSVSGFETLVSSLEIVVSTVGYCSFHGRILEYLHRDTGFPIVVDPAFNSSPLTVCLIDTLLNSCRTQVWQIPASATYLPHYLQRSNLFYIR